MNRKKFLQTSSAAVVGTGLLGWSCSSPTPSNGTGLKNWAGNVSYHSREVLYPKTLEEVQEAIRKLKLVKALGSQHSFSTIADTEGTHISTAALDKVLRLEGNNTLVWCESGIRYGTLAKWLDDKNLALHNLASLPHISVAGACATATHGSGDRCGNLATAVAAFELVRADGQVVVIDREHPDFYGAVVHLGALGIVTKIALDVQPAYQVTQHVFEDLSMDTLSQNFDAIFKSGYSVSLFTHWLDRKINQVWIKRRSDEVYSQSLSDFFGTTSALTHLHPIKSNSSVNCTDQMGIPGKWFERLPHFKMGFTPSNGDELQTEFFIPRTHAVDAILAVETLHQEVSPALFVTEIRSIAADQLWMSPAYNKDVISIHFTWKPEPDQVMPLIPKIEKVLEPFSPVPHMGKISRLTSDQLSSRFEKFAEFRNLVKNYDPERKFQNAWLDEKIF